MKRPALALLALCLSSPTLAQKPTQIAQGPTEAPYSLTTPDGTGLTLVGLDARAVVDGPLAFTELRLTFENPHDRTIEGHFQITLPDNAAISRFAMKISGAWMEGEVVEKQAARRAYEDALHRRQDPALLESDGGNLFRARVFPIRPRENKELIISWSHELTRAGETVQHGEVRIIGPVNLPSSLAYHASEMYARNLLNFLSPALKAGALTIDFADEVFAGAVVTHEGAIKHEPTAKAVG